MGATKDGHHVTEDWTALREGIDETVRYDGRAADPDDRRLDPDCEEIPYRF